MTKGLILIAATLVCIIAIPLTVQAAGPTTIGTSDIEFTVRVPFQDKAFNALGLYWVFYDQWTGGTGDIGYRTSADAVTWSPFTSLGFGGFGPEFSVVLEGSNTLHYARGDTGLAHTLSYRKGTLQSDGSIVWAAAEQTIAADANHLWGDPTIAIDSNGYPWVSCMFDEYGDSFVAYDAVVYQSNTKDGTWTTAAGFPHRFTTEATYTNRHWATTAVALASGQMYFTVYTSNNLNLSTRRAAPFGVLWNGAAFGADEPIDTAVTANVYWASTDTLAVGPDVYFGHLVTTSNDIHLLKRDSATGWGSPETVASGTTGTSSPVLSYETYYGSIYVWWAGSPTSDHIYYRERSSTGVWAPAVDWITDIPLTGNNRLTTFLPMVYSIGLLWTTESAAPFNVRMGTVGLPTPTPIHTSQTSTNVERWSAVSSGIAAICMVVIVAAIVIAPMLIRRPSGGPLG